MTSNTQYIIALNGEDISSTSATSEAGSWNFLYLQNPSLRTKSIKKLRALGYTARKLKKGIDHGTQV